MKALILLASLSVTCNAMAFLDIMVDEWNLYKASYQKEYENEIEEKYRFKIYMDNKQKILKHNTRFHRGETKYKLEVNHFADLLPHEFTAQRNGFNKSLTAPYRRTGSLYLQPENIVLPREIDWRRKGAVTPVKDQGQCGSCWAFSTTGSLEGQHFRKSGKLVSLSEQNLVDCATSYGNNGCNGGLMDNAFRYIRDNRGIDTEKSYPYEAEDDQCRYKPRNVGATDSGVMDIPEGDEQALKTAVGTVGPVSIAIDASHESFQFYQEGVYYEPQCSSENLDHGVLVVGYGTTEEGDDYWLVKNSWGTKWGLDGYVKMARNRKNNCGVATTASYPLV